MPRRQSIEFDVVFNDVDQKEIDKISKSVNKGFKEALKTDPTMIKAQKELRSLRDDQLKQLDKQNSLQTKALNLSVRQQEAVQKMHELSKRYSKTQEKINDLANKYSRKSTEIQEKLTQKRKQAANLESNIASQRKKINELNEDAIDGEEESASLMKARQKLIRDENTLSRVNADIRREDTKLQSISNDMEQERNNLLSEIESIENKINNQGEKSIDLGQKIKTTRSEQLNLQNEQHGINDKIKSQEQEISKIITDRTQAANMSIKERMALQEQAAEQIRKDDPNKSYAEALDLAKQRYPLVLKASKLDDKTEKIVTNTTKFKKKEFEFRKKDLGLLNERLKREKVGFFARRRALKEEETGMLKQFGLKKGLLGVTAATPAKAGVGAIAGQEIKQQIAGIGGLLGKLAGPLMALGGIASFVMLMLNYNKEVMKARKNLFMLASAGDETWNRIEKGQTTGIGHMESYRQSLRGLWKSVGMEYQDALQNVGSLTNAGIKLQDVLKNNATVMQEVEHMSLLSGKSFGDMAGITGEWVTEFRKDTDQLFDTFVDLRSAAAKTDFTTNRFFSSVMNAAQGLAIYGTQIEDVSAAFADLVTDVKMPQKEAAKLAAQMISATDAMTSAQKTMVAQVGGAEGMLKTEQARLQELKDTGKITEDQEKRLTSITNLLNTKYPDTLEKQTRFFESLDPGQQIELRFKALAKAAPSIFKGVDIANPDALGRVLSLNREKLAEVGKQFGFDKKQLMLVEELTAAGKSMTDIGKTVAEESGKAEEKRLAKAAKRQARIIEQGTKPWMTSLLENIGNWVEKIYLWLESYAIPFFDAALNFMGSDIKLKQKASGDVNKALSQYIAEEKKLADKGTLTKEEQARQATLKSRISELQKQKAFLAGPESRSGLGGRVVRAAGFTTKEEKAGMAATAKVTGMRYEDLKSKVNKMPPSDTRDALQAILAGQLKSIKTIGAAGKVDVSKMLENTLKSKSFRSTFPNADADVIRTMISTLGFSKGGYTGNAGISRKYAKALSGLRQFQKGGYTGFGGSSEIAGVVHPREFVFDKQSTKAIGRQNLQSLMNIAKSPINIGENNIQDLSVRSPLAAISTRSTVGGGSASGVTNNNNQNVTININQRDRQEIEQIVQKVLYERAM